MKRLIKPLCFALATLSALLSVVSCVKELAVKEQEVNFESSLTTEQSQIVKGDTTVTTQLLINEEEVDCPRPTKYSVSFTYDEEAGTLFFLGDSIQSGKPIALSSLSNLSLTYQAKKLVGNKVDVTVSNDAPKKLRKELVWNILADKTYWVKSELEGDGEITITGADDLDAVEPDTKLAVTAKPADGWELVTLTANEEDILEDKSFVVTENTTVRATFKELAPKTYKVTLTKEGEGTVAISGTDNLDTVVTGSKLTVTATPADGWSIASMTANGVDILASSSFVVESDTNVKVVFKKQPPKTYKVTLVKEGDGTVDISGADNLGAVVAGSKLTVTATPADGWEVKSITANGKGITTDKSFVVTSNTVVKVVFKKQPPKTYAVTLTKEGEGKVAISGADNLGAVVTGSKLTVTATPSDGWEVKSITANGKDITADKSFVVTSNTVVKVVFKKQPPKTYAVTLVDVVGGTVAISGADNLGAVKEGTKLTVTATPADGWEVKSITANGKDITANKTFVVNGATVVKVVFAIKTYAVTLVKEGEGRVAISGADNLGAVEWGTRLKVVATPANDWEVSSATANGVDISVGILSVKSFVVKSNTTVKVVFKKRPPLPPEPNRFIRVDYSFVDEAGSLLPVQPSVSVESYPLYSAVIDVEKPIFLDPPINSRTVRYNSEFYGFDSAPYGPFWRVRVPERVRLTKPLSDYDLTGITVDEVYGYPEKRKPIPLTSSSTIHSVARTYPMLADTYDLTGFVDRARSGSYLEVKCHFKRK